MTYINAKKEHYLDFETKLPPGRIWATPDKSSSYLRRSLLRALARRIGDVDLPQDMIEAATFDDTLLSSRLEV